MLKTVISIIALGFCYQAHADWITPGAAYRCDHEKNSFELVATIETSEEGVGVNTPQGFTSVDGREPIACKLKSTKIGDFPVAAIVLVSSGGGRASGMCAGADSASLSVLAAGAYILIKELTEIGTVCVAEPAITSLKITVGEESIMLHMCKGSWDLDTGFASSVCKDSLVLDLADYE